MNNSNPQKLSPVKIALMELVMFGEYGVSDKVGICEFIERMDSIQLESLAKTLMLLDTESDQKFLLESVYNEELQQKNSNVYMTESIFSKSRDQIILQEAEEIPANVAEILKRGGYTALALYLIREQARNPAEVARMMTTLRQTKLAVYEKVAAVMREMTRGKINYPTMKHTDAALTDLHNAQQTMANQYRAQKPITPSLKNAVEKAKEKVKAARSLDLTRGEDATKKSLKYSGLAILTMMGLTGLAILLVHIYQKYLSDAAIHCKNKRGVENKVCMLTFKIEACEVALKKCREALVGCKDKPNPEKCIHSIQTQVWNWEKRKRKYQAKISSLAKNAITPPAHPSTNPPEDRPSRDGNLEGGSVFRSKV